MADTLYLQAIPSEEVWGDLRVIKDQFILLPGIESSEVWGSFTVSREILNPFVQQMEDDLEEVFFNPDEFAMQMTLIYPDGTRDTINGIFDNEYNLVETDTGAGIMSRNPVVWMRARKFRQQIDKGSKLIVKGVRYDVVEPQPDGTGLLVLVLHQEKTV